MPRNRQSGLSDAAQKDMFGGPPPDPGFAPPPAPEVARKILNGLLKKLRAAKQAPSGGGLWERMSLALYGHCLPEEESARMTADIMRELTRLGIEKDRPRPLRYMTQERYDELTVVRSPESESESENSGGARRRAG